MPRLRAPLLAVALLLAPAPALAQATPPARTPAAGRAQAALRQEIEGRLREMEEAFARGDLAAVARFYADDARLMGPRNEIVEGRAAIDRYWAGVRNPRSWRLELLDVGGSRDDAWQLGRSTLVSGGPNGDVTSVSRFVCVWRRDAEGKLRIALDFYHF